MNELVNSESLSRLSSARWSGLKEFMLSDCKKNSRLCARWFAWICKLGDEEAQVEVEFEKSPWSSEQNARKKCNQLLRDVG